MISIFVGNIYYAATETDIQNLFSQFGAVNSVKLLKDRETGKPKGIAFVEMDEEPAQSAIDALNGKEFGGRSLKVNQARERERTNTSYKPKRF